MSQGTVRVAVIGAGMAGRAHAAGYANLRSTYGDSVPSVRLVALADQNVALATDLAGRFGFERVESRWEAIAEADDIDAVSVVVPNSEHREVVEGLLDRGKAVLCEKPLARSATEAMAMAEAVDRSGVVAQVAFTHRFAPPVAAVRGLIAEGRLGEPRQLISRYLADHGRDADVPFAWRHDLALAGGGSLVDLGSHNVDAARFMLGEITEVRGAALKTRITERHLAVGVTRGHERSTLSDETRAVTTDDEAAFIAEFENGCVGVFITSRIATGFKNSTGFVLVGSDASATFDWERLSEFGWADGSADEYTGGFTRVLLGSPHPYLAAGLVMPVAGVGFGLADTFVFQAAEFVTAVANGRPSAIGASFADGVANALILDAVKRSAADGGGRVSIDEERERAAAGGHEPVGSAA
jgi:predicted dehydrogenase